MADADLIQRVEANLNRLDELCADLSEMRDFLRRDYAELLTKRAESEVTLGYTDECGGKIEDVRSSQILVLDPAPAENRAVKNQDQWIDYWNQIQDGRRFASMADYYQVFCQLTDALRKGTAAEKASAEQSIASLRKDFRENYLITSTRIFYQPSSLEARLIHGYRASNYPQTSEKNLIVPLYWKTPIAEVYASCEGLAYLQALLDTNESGPTIAERLSAVSGFSDIRLWTPALQNNGYLARSQLAERAVGLYSYGRGFRLVADGHPVAYSSRSLGVR